MSVWKVKLLSQDGQILLFGGVYLCSNMHTLQVLPGDVHVFMIQKLLGVADIPSRFLMRWKILFCRRRQRKQLQLQATKMR